MMMATDKKFMGQFAIGFRLKVAGGICTGVMAHVVIAMFATYCFFLRRHSASYPRNLFQFCKAGDRSRANYQIGCIQIGACLYQRC